MLLLCCRRDTFAEPEGRSSAPSSSRRTGFRRHRASTNRERLAPMSFWMRFTLAVLATWRVTHLLASEDGPADIIVRFRSLLGQSLAGHLMDCFNCFSIW